VGAESSADAIQAMKAAAATEAAAMVPDGSYVGVGTGSTVAYFIEALSDPSRYFSGAVASSLETEALLVAACIPVYDMSVVGRLSLYVDGADEIDPELRLIKGAGGAMTREKICAFSAEKFVCIADASKYTGEALGRAPIPIEVIPMAHALVLEAIREMGGDPELRDADLTDNGNEIIDCTGLDLSDPEQLEITLESLPGVVGSGVFAHRRADIALIGAQDGVLRLGTPAE